MNRLLCSTLLLAVFLAFPAAAQDVLPPEPIVCLADMRTYTIRTPDMDYYDFLRAADAMVRAAAPDWYVEGTTEMPVTMQASPNLLRRFGEAWRDDQGVYHVVIGRLGLMLATVEDLASVVLHEFVHVITWEEIEAQDWSDNCKSARQELIANKVVIEHYLKLKYTSYMLNNSRRLYSQAKAKALLNFCPAEIMNGMPEVPMPIFPHFLSTFD
jgi:hypothetical protein